RRAARCGRGPSPRAPPRAPVRSQFQLPGFVHEVMPEALDAPALDAREAARSVDPARGGQLTVRPEGDLAVPGLAREPDALVDEAATDAEAARALVDDQEAELGSRGRFLDEAHRPDVLAVHLGNPAALARRVEALEEIGGDPRHDRLEARIVPVLARVDRAVLLHDPAQVARP